MEAEAEAEAEADVEVEVDEEVHVKLAAALTAAVVVARHRRALSVADSVAEPLGRALRGAEVRVVDAVAAVVLALRDVARAVAGAVADPARQAARRALAKLRLRLLDRAAAGVPAECGMWGVRCGGWGVTPSCCGPYRKPNSHEHVASVCVHETSSGESADGSHMRTKWTLDRIMRPPRSIRGERSLPHAEPL